MHMKEDQPFSNLHARQWVPKVIPQFLFSLYTYKLKAYMGSIIVGLISHLVLCFFFFIIFYAIITKLKSYRTLKMLGWFRKSSTQWAAVTIVLGEMIVPPQVCCHLPYANLLRLICHGHSWAAALLPPTTRFVSSRCFPHSPENIP